VGTVIKISSPEQQLRQNRLMLLAIGGVSSFAGLMLWSVMPFAANNAKNQVHIGLRYFALLSSLGCGISAAVCGHQLQKISPLIQAVDAAEERDFLTQLAVAEYVQQQSHRAAYRQPLSPVKSESGNAGNESSNESGNGGNVDGASGNGVTEKRYQTVTAESRSESAESESPESPESALSLAASFKPYYLAVLSARARGESDSKIIKEILRQEGRNYEKGKQMLQTLLQLGQSQGW